jgi:hypothetical protein
MLSQSPGTVKELESHIRYLSDDLLEGRAVGTKGIEMAARYQEDYFKTMGLEPAFGASYRQTFPLKGSRADPSASLEIVGPDVTIAPVLGNEFVIRTEREDAPAEAAGDLVYYGYLVQAPERNWDLRGTLQIIDWDREIITILQEREALPQFLPTSSFRRGKQPKDPG